jgi:chorismate mutase
MLRIDKLYDVTALGIKNVSVRMLTAAQKEKPEAIVSAIAVLLLMVCSRYRIEPRAVLDVTTRIIRDAQDNHPVEMRAMKRYIAKELPDA